MPKKTKKAKLIAEYRKKLQRLEHTPVSEDQTMSHERFTLPIITQPINTPSTVVLPSSESDAIKKELIKTLIIVTAFICAEFLLARFIR